MTNCLLKSFGLVVRRLRESHHWSQEQLAEKADLNRSYIGEIERGQVVVSLLTIEKLAGALGISSAHLLEQSAQQQCAMSAKAIRLTAIAC